MRIAICLPCRDSVHTGFAYDLARLSAFIGATRVPKGAKLHMFTSQGTLIADQRQNLVQEALAVGADHILFIDTDMRFPKNGFDRLLDHGKPIVAANYATRRLPPKPVAFADETCTTRVYTTDATHGLEKVYAVGMGFMLVDANVFRAMPAPWFQIGYSTKQHDFFGEDVFFCHQAAKHGFEIFIDHDLSKDIRHIGNLEFGYQHCEACIDDVKAEATESEGA